MKVGMHTFFNKRVLSIASVLIFLCSIYLYYENTSVMVTSHTIKNEKIPDEFNGFKIAQLTDFHNAQSITLTKKIIQGIEREKPDVIFITGDLIDANTTNIDIAIDFINQIKDIAPIYYVTGNHEGSTSEYSKLKQGLRENGVIILENIMTEIKKGYSSINVLGIDDPIFSGSEPESKAGRIKLILSKFEYDKNKYSILLSHRPELFSVYSSFDIDLVFAGHAHGGQIRVPFVGGLYAPGQGFMPKLTSGIHQKEKTTMVISRGLGNSSFPFRVNNRPEIIVATLTN